MVHLKKIQLLFSFYIYASLVGTYKVLDYLKFNLWNGFKSAYYLHCTYLLKCPIK